MMEKECHPKPAILKMSFLKQVQDRLWTPPALSKVEVIRDRFQDWF